jgi:DNA-binding NtrC family response regulator
MLGGAKTLVHGQQPRAGSASRSIAVVAIADTAARRHAAELLEGMRWSAIEAGSGAQAFTAIERSGAQALLLDSWLPDLDLNEFLRECRERYPTLDVVMLDHAADLPAHLRHPRRHELLHVLRQALEHNPAPSAHDSQTHATAQTGPKPQPGWSASILPEDGMLPSGLLTAGFRGHFAEPKEAAEQADPFSSSGTGSTLSEFVGSSPAMARFTRMIRLVAPRKTTVLIEGATGTGKELTARAIHRLSTRASRPMVVLNCAAIPESLLEAEVFGHTKGAFTGAVSSRVGRIEAAHGGTLFLDEIGEMPLALQSKLLRFLESGELQRVGENDSIKVDVRVIAATNQPLGRRVAEGAFRGDLYYRLAVFPLAPPRLQEHAEDIPQLVKHFLKLHAENGPAKQMGADAMEKIMTHSWPGNVRELEHCVERAYILADQHPAISARHIQFGNF